MFGAVDVKTSHLDPTAGQEASMGAWEMGGEDDQQQIQHSYLFDALLAYNCYGIIYHSLMFVNLGLVDLIWLVARSIGCGILPISKA